LLSIYLYPAFFLFKFYNQLNFGKFLSVSKSSVCYRDGQVHVYVFDGKPQNKTENGDKKQTNSILAVLHVI